MESIDARWMRRCFELARAAVGRNELPFGSVIARGAEVLSAEGVDSTEMGRIVPVYEAIGRFSSRMIRCAIYGTLQNLDDNIPDILPAGLREKLNLPSRRDATIRLWPSAAHA